TARAGGARIDPPAARSRYRSSETPSGQRRATMAKLGVIRQPLLVQRQRGYNMLREIQEAPMSAPNTTSSPSSDPSASGTGYTGNWRDQRRAERQARRAAWR